MTFEQSHLYIESFESLDKRLKVILESLHKPRFSVTFRANRFHVQIQGYQDDSLVIAESNEHEDFRTAVAHAIYNLTSI